MQRKIRLILRIHRPPCYKGNAGKKLSTPVEEALKKIAGERKERDEE